jgi:hypothetical protein
MAVRGAYRVMVIRVTASRVSGRGLGGGFSMLRLAKYSSGTSFASSPSWGVPS